MENWAATVMRQDGAAGSPWLIVCEHASNAFPQPWGDLGLDAETRLAHVAWDPGALGLAQALANHLHAPLFAGTVSRLIYDLNRPPASPSAMAATSEIFTIPGNRNLTNPARQMRVERLYRPFHAALSEYLSDALDRGIAPALITVHSFSPVWFGQRRTLDLGFIHDAEPTLAEAAVTLARQYTELQIALNAPYAAADGVTHTLMLHATPHGLPHVMIEVRNDLIATPAQQQAMADSLARILIEARDAMQQRGAA